jgi:multimeric flavodoxin WrbA
VKLKSANKAEIKAMKVLLINGSPHQQGCTFTALSEIAVTLNKNDVDSEMLWIGSKPLAGCTACMTCRESGKCIFDDVVNKCAAKIAECDGFIFGSPVYFASANGAMISFMDRLFFSSRSSLAGKPAAAVMSCRRGGSTATFDQMNKYFCISNMPVVPSQYWNMVHGNSPDEVRQDLEGLQTMRTLGQNMAWILKCIDAGKTAGINRPVYEEPLRTNFIR